MLLESSQNSTIMSIIPHCLACNTAYSWRDSHCPVCGERTISGWSRIVFAFAIVYIVASLLYKSPMAVASRNREDSVAVANAQRDSLWGASKSVRRSCETAVEARFAPTPAVEWGIMMPLPLQPNTWRLRSFIDFDTGRGRRRIKYTCEAVTESGATPQITRLDIMP